MKRLEYDQPVARLADGAQQGGKPLGGSQHDGDLGLRIGAKAVEPLGVPGDGRAQLGQAERIGVLVEAVPGILQPREEFPERHPEEFLRAQAGLFPDLREGEILDPLDLLFVSADHGGDAAPHQIEERRLVRESLGEIDRLVLDRQAGHQANDRFFHIPSPITERRLLRCSGGRPRRPGGS